MSVSDNRNVTPDIEAVAPKGRIAVVGAGAFGRFCIATYRRYPDLSVVAVADPDESALVQIDAPGTDLVPDWREVVTRPDVEVIHVAAPPWLRGEIVDVALAAGKSVFCEKPLALTLDEADSMIEAASRAGVALSVDYVMRHHPAFHLLYALAGSGLLGGVRSISLENYAQAVPPAHWFWDRERSGGILVEHGVHFFDAYGHLVGPALQARGQAPRCEAVAATVQYRGGAVGRYYHEFAFPGAVELAQGLVFFDRGYVEIEGWIPERMRGAVLAPPHSVEEIASRTGWPTQIEADDVTRFSAHFGDRTAAYSACITAGMRDVVLRHRSAGHGMEVLPSDARRSLALALTAQQSIETGEAEVLGEEPEPVAIADD